jgi:hypothetical protein
LKAEIDERSNALRDLQNEYDLLKKRFDEKSLSIEDGHPVIASLRAERDKYKVNLFKSRTIMYKQFHYFSEVTSR